MTPPRSVIRPILAVGVVQAWLAREFRSTKRETNVLLSLPWLLLVFAAWVPTRLLYLWLFRTFIPQE